MVLLLMVAQAAPPTWSPTAEEQNVYGQLLSRDGSPDCASLDAAMVEPVTTLNAIVEHASEPAWASMRAADCLVALHPWDASESIESWLVDPERRGLAMLVTNQLDLVPAPLAARWEELALRGPNGPVLAPRVERARARREVQP